MSTRPMSFSPIEQMVLSEALEKYESQLVEREQRAFLYLSTKEHSPIVKQLNALRRVQKRLRP